VRDKAAVEILSHFMGKDEDTESSDTSLWYVKKEGHRDYEYSIGGDNIK
jgi:hypothetical protein